MALNYSCSHRGQHFLDLVEFLQALVKVKVAQGSNDEEGRCQTELKVEKYDEEGHLM